MYILFHKGAIVSDTFLGSQLGFPIRKTQR